MQKTNFTFEIYIYDDCSTDGTSDIIREYASKYKNIIHDLQSENYYSKDPKLHLKKTMLNIKEHDCKYVAIVEGDDYWTDPYKLQLQVDFLENHRDFSMCSGGWIINDDFDGNQIVKLIEAKRFTEFEYDFSKAQSSTYLVKNFTRVYRTEAIPGHKIAQKYKLFRDVHVAYYVLQNGKGYYFHRIFGISNKHSGGIFNGLNAYERREISYKVFEEIYCETRDDQIKKYFLPYVQNHVKFYLKSEAQCTDFYKKFIKKFPELSVDIENIIFQKKLSEENH